VKYNCRNCGSVFEGDDFTLECPKCDSTEFDIYGEKADKQKPESSIEEKVEKGDKTVNISVSDGASNSGKTVFIRPEDLNKDANPTVNIPPSSKSGSEDFQNHKEGKQIPKKPDQTTPITDSNKSNVKQLAKKKSSPFTIIIIIGLILILGAAGLWYFSQSDSGKVDDKKEVLNTETEVKVRIEENEGAFFIKGSLIEGNQEKDLQAKDILAVYRANDRREVNFNKTTGQIYFCQDMEGLTAFALEISEYNGPEAITNGIELSLFGKLPAPEAQCRHRLESRFINISFTSSCEMVVEITDPHDYGDESFDVSISGKEGEFIKEKFKWNVEAMMGQAVDVWVKQPSFTPVAYSQNDTRVIPNCGNDVDWDAIKGKLAIAAQKYGANPDDRVASQEVQELSMNSLPGKPIFIVDGKELSGFSALSTKFRIDHMNEGKTFELSSQPQLINKRYWKIEYNSK